MDTIGGIVPTNEQKKVYSTSLSPAGSNNNERSRLDKVNIKHCLGNKVRYEKWVHLPWLCLLAACPHESVVCRRRIPILVVGSAARHVNACCLHIIKGILQLLPSAQWCPTRGPGTSRGTQGGPPAKWAIVSKGVSHKRLWFTVISEQLRGVVVA